MEPSRKRTVGQSPYADFFLSVVLVHRKYFCSAGGLGMQPTESNAQGSNHSFSAKLPASKQAMVTSTSVDDATTGGSHQV